MIFTNSQAFYQSKVIEFSKTSSLSKVIGVFVIVIVELIPVEFIFAEDNVTEEIKPEENKIKAKNKIIILYFFEFFILPGSYQVPYC